MSNWINASDRLPKKHGLYLCYGKSLSTEVEVLDFFDLTWRWEDDLKIALGVTHWQPFPKLPRA